MRLEPGEEVCSLIVVDGEGDILTASERGYGKRTPEADYPRKGRGTKGVIALQTTARNGKLVGAIQLSDSHEVLLISRSEEHTSELQSLMRISYAVFCLKKKNKKT